MDPNARIGLLVSSQYPDGVEARAERVSAETIHLALALATDDRIQSLQDLGYHVYVYTVDRPQEIRHLIECGVDGIFTNHPAQLHHLLVESY